MQEILARPVFRVKGIPRQTQPWYFFSLRGFIIIIIIIIIVIIIELTHYSTKLLDYIQEIKPQPVALDFKNLS